MLLNKINNLTDTCVVDILSNGLTGIEDISKENYSPEFKNNPANLFYLLKNGRYTNGCYYVLSENDKYIASAGWNMYDTDTALLMTRSYTMREYRTKFILGNYLLPRMIEEAFEFNNVWISFNEYNKGLYDWISRGIKGKESYWPESWHRFRPIGMKEIYHTNQYVIELIK